MIAYDGIPLFSWITKVVTLPNETRVEVAKAICQSVDAHLVIDLDGKPLGDNCIAIQIVESLSKANVLSSWMWSMQLWHISKVHCGVYNRWSYLLGVQKQIHHDSSRRAMITLASHEVCFSA